MLSFFLLLLLISTVSSASTVQFCADNDSHIITTTAITCPPNTHQYSHLGTNLFDIFWDAWSPSATANLSTSLKAIQDAGASGISIARTFAVPWTYSNVSWGWFNPTTRDNYFYQMDTIIQECERMNIQLIPSLGYGCSDSNLGCNPSNVCPGETYRDFITNPSSCTRQTIYAYVKDVVLRYKNSSTIAFWELGNEMNLAWDGCSYDKSDGSFFTSTEGLQFLHEYSTYVKSLDSTRLVNTGLASPRLRAAHLAQTPGGGKNCVSPSNPKGDCDLYCPSIDYDTLIDTQNVLATYFGNNNFDMMSIHWYGCSPPNGNYTWCPSNDNATVVPLSTFKQTADNLGVALYVGEYGPSTTSVPTGWGPSAWEGQAYISAMLEFGIQLSTFWAFECPSHSEMDGTLCIHPGRVQDNAATFTTIENLQYIDRAMQNLPPSNLNLTLYMLDPPRPGSNSDPACLDGTAYGYYARLGKDTSTVVVTLQGGGWCVNNYDCYERTLEGYAGGDLGSSKYWESWSWGWWFGPRFVDATYLYLPYCDGASYSGLVYDPITTNYGPNGNATLYFRGASNMVAGVNDFLNRFNLTASPKSIIVTGGSAGGLSVTLHIDRLQSLMNAEASYGVPQCGFFAYYNNTCQGSKSSEFCNATDQFRNVFTIHNVTGTMLPSCLQDNPGTEAYKCFMAPTVTQYVKAPLFIWQSKFDHFQLNAFVDLDCMWNQTYNPPWNANITCNEHDTNLTMAYGELFMSQIQPYINTPGPFRAVYLTSCVLHGMDYNYLSVSETTPNVAFNLWYDALTNPNNPPTITNDFKWIEDYTLPRTDNPLACPPFIFTSTE